MKNLKVSQKLIVSFMIVVFLAVAVGGVGIFGMTTIEGLSEGMYKDQLLPLEYLAYVQEIAVSMRAYAAEMAVAGLIGDQKEVEYEYGAIVGYREKMTKYLDLYQDSAKPGTEATALFLQARSWYEKEFTTTVNNLYNAARAEDADRITSLIEDSKEYSYKIIDNLDTCMDFKVEDADEAYNYASKMADTLLFVIIGVLVAVVAISMGLAVYISGLISKPVKALSGFLHKAGLTGNVSTTPEEERTLSRYAEGRDEIAVMTKDCNSFIDHVVKIAKNLETVAGGDLTVNVHTLSDQDVMGKSLMNVVDSLNNMFSEINSSTVQVSSGSKQIADSAQALASGSTEQAATVEQLSASVSDISDKTKNNANMAGKAASLANDIKLKAETGSRQMDEMIAAVNEINQASQSISKVIKVIDDIAFQTNILALNAAVEAARAGQHGKGFAVVAEEVRNLAAKSAEAAKDTGGLIANSMEKAELGARIAQETAASLTEIVEGINESSRIVAEIATSSEEQSSAVEQINIGLSQVTQVIQQNSATAEESAAASDEMSSQAQMLETLVMSFGNEKNN